MKKILAISLIGLLACCEAFSQGKPGSSYKITIDARRLRPASKKLFISFLKQTNKGKVRVVDSAVIKDGTAVFTGAVAEPVALILQTDKFDTIKRICLSNNFINIKTGSKITALNITGSPYQNDFEKLEAGEAAYKPALLKLDEDYAKATKAKDGHETSKIMAETNALNRKMQLDVYSKYLKQHSKTSALSVYALSGFETEDVKDMQSYYALLSTAFRKMPSALALKKRIDDAISVSVGQLAIGFSLPDTLGKMVSLSSFKGKYVLLDFWASWCHPCRAESPYMMKAYDRFSAKNFTILSVSLDDKKSKNAWTAAIHKDNVTKWVQVSDLKGWESDVAIAYHIQSIPQNYLLDPDGRIIAKDLRGEELEKKLAEILQ